MSRVLACLTALFLIPLPTSVQVERGVIAGFSQAAANTPPTRDARPATGRSTIRGRVLRLDGGQSLRRAEVRINASELRVGRRVLTDMDGRYEFRDLPAGRYSLTASKTTFVSMSYGQTQPGTPSKPLALADNQTADNINISLPRGAVITGRVVDDFGETVPNARVALMRQQFRRGQRSLVLAGPSGSTNDIGEYRLFGAAPGQYYVSAMVQQGIIAGPGGPDALEGPEARNGYAATFYPGTADAAAAQKLTLTVGQTLTEINLVLLATRAATITGTAVDAEGQPMAGALVQIMPRGGPTGLGGPAGFVRPDGTFSIPSVPPGDYLLRANNPRPSQTVGPQFGQPPGQPEVSVAFANVNGEDVTDIRLAPIVPVSIAGRVTFEDQAAAQSMKPTAVRVMTLGSTIADAGIGIGSQGFPLPVNDDFAFDLKTTPGLMSIQALAPGWQVKAVRVNGTDVTDSELDVSSKGMSGVEIEMTNRLQEISGAVTDTDGKPVADYVVVIFAQDRSRWAAAFNRYGATGRPGADRRFKVATLPAGDYYAIALDRSDAGEGQDPEFLEGLARLATTVSLAPGDRRTVELKLFVVQ